MDDGWLYLDVITIGSAYSVQLNYKRAVSYRVGDQWRTIPIATTWSKSVSGTAASDERILQNISDLAELFLNEFIKANEKK